MNIYKRSYASSWLFIGIILICQYDDNHDLTEEQSLSFYCRGFQAQEPQNRQILGK